MLVLTRKVGEAISIGDDVKIVVMQVKGKQVRLGIKASASTIVHREEVYQRIQEENELASQVSGVNLSSVSKMVNPKGVSLDNMGNAPLRRRVPNHKKSS